MPFDPDKTLEKIEDPKERRYRLAKAVSKKRGIQTGQNPSVPVAEQLYRNVSGLAQKEGVPIGEALDLISDPAAQDPATRRKIIARSIAEAKGWAPEKADVAAGEYLKKYQASKESGQGVSDTPETTSYHQTREEHLKETLPNWQPSGQPPMQPGGGDPAFKMPGLPGLGGFGKFQKGFSEQADKTAAAYEKAAGQAGEVAGKEIAATEAMRDAQIAQNEAVADVYEHAAARHLEYEGKLGEVERQRKEHVQAETGKLQNAITQFRQMKLDPQRLFRNSDGSTNFPRKVGAALAVFFGSLGNQMQGRSGNPTLDLIERAIDRDIEAQQADIQKAGQAVNIQFNVLGAMRKLFSDEKSAVLAARGIALEHVQIELEQKKAMTRSPIEAANADRMIAAIEEKKFQNQAKFDLSSNEEATRILGIKAGLYTQQKGLEFQRAGLQTARIGAMAKAQGQQTPALKNFAPYRQVEKDERTEARKISDRFDPVVSTIDFLIQKRNEMGVEPFSAWLSENSAVYESLHGHLKMLLKEGYAMGALQKHEQEFLEELTPDPSSAGNVIPQLETLNERFKRQYADMMYNRGYNPTGLSIPVGDFRESAGGEKTEETPKKLGRTGRHQ